MSGNIIELSVKKIEPWTWLQSQLPLSPISEELRELDWGTVHAIQQDQTRFQKLIKERPFLMAQYRIQAAYVVQLSSQTHKYDPHLRQEIEKALKMTVLLEKIYLQLDEPDDVIRAKIDIAILEMVLHRIDAPNSQRVSAIPVCHLGFSNALRGIHAGANLSRLAAIRARRLILASQALPACFTWKPTIAKVEYFTAPVFLHLGWIFFLPRFFLNLTTLLKKGLLSQKSGLPWYLRLEAYLNLHRRLYELWTDTAWFTSGILLSFVLFDSLAVWRPFTIIAVQISDTVMMTTRSFFELRRLFILKKEYEENVRHELTPENPGYLQSLEERIAFEKKVSYLAITNNVLMSVALLSILPAALTYSPILPVLGAALGLLTTLRFYAYNAANESQQPRTNLSVLLKNYEIKTAATPATAPAGILFNKLSAPALLALTPLIFIGSTIHPPLIALFCVGLVCISYQQLQQPTKIQACAKNYEAILNHRFFKPDTTPQDNSEKANIAARRP